MLHGFCYLDSKMLHALVAVVVVAVHAIWVCNKVLKYWWMEFQ